MIYKTYALFRNKTLGLFAAIIYASLSFSAVHAVLLPEPHGEPIARGGLELPTYAFLPDGDWTLRGSYERVVHGSPDKVEVTKFYSPRPAGTRSYAVVEQWEPNKVPTVRGRYISNSTVTNQVYKLGQLDWSSSRRVVVEGENNCKANIYKFKYLGKKKTIYHTCGPRADRGYPSVSSQEINVKNKFEDLATFVKWYGTRVAESEVLFQSSFNAARLIRFAETSAARQSSTGWGGVASRAIDGNRSGDYNDGSVTHTNGESQPFWEVDLGKLNDISNIRLWNRTNCCSNRLANFHVLVSDVPFDSRRYADIAQQKGVSDYYHRGTITGDNIIIPINRLGRYVRVQIVNTGRAATSILSLAEVEILSERTSWWTGSYAIDDYYNYTQEKGGQMVVDQSTTLNDGKASKAIDGNTSGGRQEVTMSVYQSGQWWEVDLGRSVPIDAVRIFNRTDCCSERLKRFNVLVSDEPFTKVSYEYYRNKENVFYHHQREAVNKNINIPVVRSGRYVRVWLEDFNYLSLAEVQVLVHENRITTRTLPSVQYPYNYIKEESAVAKQSSTHGPGVASRAIDGNTSGDWRHNSVTHTGWQKNAWWEVDLGRVVHIDALRLFNRTDCCSERLNNSTIFISDVPFTTNDYGTINNLPNVFIRNIAYNRKEYYRDVNRSGRYIRVQLRGTNYLSLAEIQVLLNKDSSN